MKAAALIIMAGLAAAPTVAQTAEHHDAAAMRAARDALYESHGGATTWLAMGERLEYQANDVMVWEGHGWVGGDIHKAWFKTEGEYQSDENRLEEFELQALYSKAVRPFWDVQAGIRYDVKPNPSRSYAVIGLQGTAPYWFEIDAAVFLSNKGDLSARFEAEYELRLTQRLFLQPRLELNLAASDDEAIGVGAGLSTAQAGLRLRYEFAREFAPYLGVSWSRAFGETADLANDARRTSFVAGIRFWF